jgi:hypothetical protein
MTKEASVIEADERRKEPRYPSEEPAVVTLLTSGEVLQADTMDISKSGLRVRSMSPLDSGTRLRVRFGTVIAFGQVRWCREVHGSTYDIGILVDHTLAQELVDSVHEALGRVRKGAGA